MVKRKIDDEILKALGNTGLNKEESHVYYTLIQYGQKGTTVRILNLELKEIERTTIYHILQKLLIKGFVINKSSTKTLNKAKIFIALEPSTLYNRILNKKKEDYETFGNTSSIFLDRLQKIYEKKEEYTLDDIDPLIRAYVSPLLNSGWKISYQLVEKKSKVFGYDFYSYNIDSPKAGPFKGYGGFHIYVFDHIVEETSSTNKKTTKEQPLLLPFSNTELNYVVIQIKRIIKERFQDEFKLHNVRITESKLSIESKTFSSFIVKIKSEKDTEYRKALDSIIFPIENKFFFIWAIRAKMISEMLRIVLKVEYF